MVARFSDKLPFPQAPPHRSACSSTEPAAKSTRYGRWLWNFWPRLACARASSAHPAPRRTPSRHHHPPRAARTDDYDWLRAKDDPEVRAYLEAENAYTEARTEHLAALRQQIFEEIKSRTLETDLSVPTRVRGHWYYGRTFEGRQYGASCRVPVIDADDWTPPRPAEDAAADQPALPGEELLLDLDALAEGHEFFSLGGSSVSPDDRLLAYGTDVVGDERYTVRVLDLATRRAAPRRDHRRRWAA